MPTSLESPRDANGFHFNKFDWSILGDVQRKSVIIVSNMYAGYVTYIPLADTSVGKAESAYLKDIFADFEDIDKILSDNGND